MEFRENFKTAAVKMDQAAYVTTQDMSFDLMAAVFEATAARRADALGAMDLDVADHVATLQSLLADVHDPDRILLCMAPPARFYRRNWQSFSLRLLNSCTQSRAKPSKSTRQVDQGC